MQALDDLASVLRFDATTGHFFWRDRLETKWAGKRAGALNSNGYRIISVEGARYREHHLAWLFWHGSFPPSFVDHRNGNKADNRPSNLRLATKSENAANSKRRSDNTSGLKGVHRHKDSWRSRICKDGKTVEVGCFPTKEEAHAAYLATAERLFGNFARAA